MSLVIRNLASAFSISLFLFMFLAFANILSAA